jgi:hypothetical protein
LAVDGVGVGGVGVDVGGVGVGVDVGVSIDSGRVGVSLVVPVDVDGWRWCWCRPRRRWCFPPFVDSPRFVGCRSLVMHPICTPCRRVVLVSMLLHKHRGLVAAVGSAGVVVVPRYCCPYDLEPSRMKLLVS